MILSYFLLYVDWLFKLTIFIFEYNLSLSVYIISVIRNINVNSIATWKTLPKQIEAFDINLPTNIAIYLSSYI